MLELRSSLYRLKVQSPALAFKTLFVASTVAFAPAIAGLDIASGAVQVSNLKPKQGEAIEVKYHPNDDAPRDGAAPGDSDIPRAGDTSRAGAATVQFLKAKIQMFPSSTADGDLRALIAIPADLDPGAYKIKIGSEEKVLNVLDGGFPLQHLSLPKSKDNFDTSPGEEEAVNKAKASVSPTRLWTGNFTVPSKARRSAAFGLKRVVNGKLLKDYFHSGLDFAANLGSPVVACAPGRVVLARTGFKLHGNVIAIDHGQGVVSFYIHLKKLLVKQDDMVEAGQEIGLVGMTGRANGPHLHFSIYVNQTASNPTQWFAKAL